MKNLYTCFKRLLEHRRMLCLLMVISVLLNGCSFFSQDNSRNKQAEVLFSKLSVDSEYGENAYQYLEFIQDHLANREMGSEQEKNTAEFIVNALLYMGYTKENIKLQTFSINQEPSVSVEQNPLTNEFLDKSQKDKSQNIILTVPGKSDKVIVVGAHYDSVKTKGVDDNGSGVSVLLESAFRRKDADNPYTIRYIFFGAEEVGTKGSNYYVKCMPDADVQNIEFMINIDSVLAGDYRYILGGAQQEDGTVTQTELLYSAYEAAQQLNLNVRLNMSGLRYPALMGTQRSDHYAFSSIGIPYVYFWADNLEKSDVQETEKLGMIMHTNQDDLNVINSAFGTRAKETLFAYSKLLEYMLANQQ